MNPLPLYEGAGSSAPEARARTRRRRLLELQHPHLVHALPQHRAGGRAKELLAATDLPVAAVARRVGYDDPACFSRLFTRRVGLAPVRFRAQQGRTVPGGWSDRVPDPDDPPVISCPHAP